MLTKNVKRIRKKNQRGSLSFFIGPFIDAIAAKAATAGAIAAKAAVAANAGAMAIGAAKASLM